LLNNLHDPLLVTQQLSRTLGKTQVLKNIDISIAPGEFVSIMGPSGSGKTTLLYLLGALDQPTSGRILLNGIDMAGLKDDERSALRQQHLGFVFQFHYLLPELNALENVAIAALLAGHLRTETEDRARELLCEMGLEHRLTHRPAELSGGEQQRVAIARALMNRPQLILADEPTGNLDTENTQRIFEILNRLNQKENLAIVLVTHNAELAALTHRQIYLRDGALNTP
jgi:lipoprotein-releasing system ATP-binding protein